MSKKIKHIKLNGKKYVIEGKSAYQIACDRGFVGTEEEWLASLAAEATEKAKESARVAEAASSDAETYATSAGAARNEAENARANAEDERKRAEQARADAEAHTAEHIRGWLDEHPEATTTVQDHSLTIDKMVIGTLGYITPQMFGAKADGVTDDTDAVKNAVAALTDNSTLYFPSGVYLVKSPRDYQYIIWLQNLKNITVCGDGAKIKLGANGWTQYRIICVDMCDNVVIRDLEIEGDRLEHDYKTTAGTHENAYGIFVQGGMDTHPVNVKILNCNIHNITGDSIATKNGVSGGTIFIKDCELHHSRRQGISILDSDTNIIEDCHIHHIGDYDGVDGASPRCGIDIEPASGTTIAKKVIVKNTKIEECTHLAVVSALSYEVVQDVEFENCIFHGGMSLYNTAGGNPIAENSVRGKFKNCEFFMTESMLKLPCSVLENCKITANKVNGEMDIPKLINCHIDGKGYFPRTRFNVRDTKDTNIINSFVKEIAIHSSGSVTQFGEALNCVFEGCKYTMYNGSSSAIFNNCTIKNPIRETEVADQGRCGGVLYNRCLIINDCEYEKDYAPKYKDCTIITQDV